MAPRPKNRVINPALFTDEAHMALSPHAELLWIGILCDAFDDGVFEWKPISLKAKYRPGHDVDPIALLDELLAGDLVRRFEANGKAYGAIRNFRLFQSPNHPNSSGIEMPADLAAYVGRKRKGSTGSDGSEDGGSTPAARQAPKCAAQSPRKRATEKDRGSALGRQIAIATGETGHVAGLAAPQNLNRSPSPENMFSAPENMFSQTGTMVSEWENMFPTESESKYLDEDSPSSVGPGASPAHAREAPPGGDATDGPGEVLKIDFGEAGQLPPDAAERLRQALGGRVRTALLTPAGLLPLRDLCRQGCDFEADIIAELSEVGRHVGDLLKSWTGFVGPQILARSRRRLAGDVARPPPGRHEAPRHGRRNAFYAVGEEILREMAAGGRL